MTPVDISVGCTSRAEVLRLSHWQLEAMLAGAREDKVNRLVELADAVDVELFIRIAQQVCIARRKHPDWSRGHEYARKVVESEMLEFAAQARLVLPEPGEVDPVRKEKADKEAFDVIATLIRYLLGDYQQNTKEGERHAL